MSSENNKIASILHKKCQIEKELQDIIKKQSIDVFGSPIIELIIKNLDNATMSSIVRYQPDLFPIEKFHFLHGSSNNLLKVWAATNGFVAESYLVDSHRFMTVEMQERCCQCTSSDKHHEGVIFRF